MLKSRIIPTLLIKNKGLVKSTNFKDYKYVGDPLNAVRIFNEKYVDELIVLDIDATAEGREPDYTTIGNMADECRMPLCYGGGIKTVEQAGRILGLGVEKISISSAAFENPELISVMADRFGSQSVVVVIDARKKRFSNKYECYTHNGTLGKGVCPFEFAKKCQDLGAGEIVINSIDHDGKQEGFDLKLIKGVRNKIKIPMTVLGGAGKFEDLKIVQEENGIVGLAAGSLFVFKGKFRAVLISYPSLEEKNKILG